MAQIRTTTITSKVLGDYALRVSQEGEGPRRFVCLHGLVDDLTIWDRLAPSLAERGQLTRYDQRGHGTSDAPPGPYSRDDMASDAIALMDALAIEEAILVGHSMGGTVATVYAGAKPDRVDRLTRDCESNRHPFIRTVKPGSEGSVDLFWAVLFCAG